MKCRDCNLELRIKCVDITFENDDTPSLETKAYANQKFYCANKGCKSFDIVQKVNRVSLN